MRNMRFCETFNRIKHHEQTLQQLNNSTNIFLKIYIKKASYLEHPQAQ